MSNTHIFKGDVDTSKPGHLFHYNGQLHSKVVVHLDMSIQQFTDMLIKGRGACMILICLDIETSVMQRVELMSDEAKESESKLVN